MEPESSIVRGPWPDLVGNRLVDHAVQARHRARVEALVEQAVALLRSVEWAGDATAFVCPVCRRHKVQDHETWCALAAALR